MPEDAPIEPSDDALPSDHLRYPEFAVGDGVAADGSVAAERDLTREELCAWLSDLGDGVVSHDVAVEGDDHRATFGVAPDGVAVSFEPDENYRGTLEFTFRFRARAMDVADADAPKVGARGGRGFIPFAMLAEDADPAKFRCYNWASFPVPDETD